LVDGAVDRGLVALVRKRREEELVVGRGIVTA